MGANSTVRDACDRVFSIWIRKRDADEWSMVRCCTCNTRAHTSEMTCGHFMARGNMSTRWDEQNCAGQCYACQGRNNGERALFAEYIDERYGEGTSDALRIKSIHPRKYEKDEIQALRRHYSKKSS